MDFAATIRSLRKARGLSQRALANALHQAGISADVSYLSKIENGKLAVLPSADLIRALAALLDTDPEMLLALAGKFDTKALQARIRQNPELAVLVRRLLNPTLTKEQIEQLTTLLPDHRPQR